MVQYGYGIGLGPSHDPLTQISNPTVRSMLRPGVVARPKKEETHVN